MIKHAFRSGMSRSNDFYAAVEAGVPVGLVASEGRFMLMLVQIPKYLKRGGAVFVDSGAFSAFRKGTQVDFQKMLSRYEVMIDSALMIGAPLENLYLVSPDAVGDQVRTLELLGQHRAELASIVQSGAKLIVPIQCGELPVAVMLAKAVEILGTDQFVAGIPSNEAAMTISQAATLKHHTFHILGRVQRNEQQEARIAALRTLNPDAGLTADANWMRSRTALISSTTEKVKAERRSSKEPRYQLEGSRTAALTRMIRADTAWAN